MADTLTAAMVNDPLFGGDGTPVDPGVLLTPPAGKRARVSVISFVGLHSDEQRQGFVNQLQMALFASIKRNPQANGHWADCSSWTRPDTRALQRHHRVHREHPRAGLAGPQVRSRAGLRHAGPTRAAQPHPGNAATQFFGLFNSPIQIAAAKEMAQAKGGAVQDISLLTAGQFYGASEGLPFTKLTTPLCLSYHPTRHCRRRRLSPGPPGRRPGGDPDSDLGPAAYAQLGQDVLDVRATRFWGNVQRIGNLPVGSAGGHPTGNLDLPAGQAGVLTDSRERLDSVRPTGRAGPGEPWLPRRWLAGAPEPAVRQRSAGWYCWAQRANRR